MNGTPLPLPTDKWTVYGQLTCGYTRAVIETKVPGMIFHPIVDRKVMTNDLGLLIGDYKTIPLVFYYGHFIGGHDDFMRMIGLA